MHRFVFLPLLFGICMAVSAPVPAFSQENGKVVAAVYAGSSARMWRDRIAAPFSKATGIPASIFEAPLPAAAVAAAGGHPQFNVALIAEYSAPLLAQKGLIKLFNPNELQGLQSIPKKFWPTTPEGKVMGIPIYFGLYGIAYNTQLAKASDFTSWKDLLNPKWKGQISITAPNFMAAYDLNLFSKISGGDEKNLQPGYDFLKRLAPQALNVYSSMASVESQLGSGEVVAAPYYADQVALMQTRGDNSVAVTIPREGGLILPYMLVIPAGAADEDAATRFLNSVVQPQYEAAFSEASHVWPMNPATKLPDDLANKMGSGADAMNDNINLDWWYVGIHLPDHTQKIQAITQSAN